MTTRLHLKAENIEVQAGNFRLLSNVNFELSSGHALILRGSNGIGKTSLLKVIAGLARPAHGSLELVTEDKAQHFDISENSHFLGHKHGLKVNQTVGQNLSFFTSFYGGAPEKLSEALKRLSLMRLQDLPIRLLSAGQKQRTAFARLTLHERPLWLLDEPTASLDAETSRLIETLCFTHLENSGMIIAATHLPFLEESKYAQTFDLHKFVPKKRWAEPA